MKKKGQMSLEMIIGLLILLVVAVVVIRIFLQSMSGAEDLGVKEELKYKEFKSNCETLCSNYKAGGSRATLAKYCYTKMSGEPDLNGDGLINKFPADTKILEVCEDMIYCFHVTECDTDSGVIGWGDCRNIVCEAVRRDYGIYNDVELDSTVKSKYFPSVGTCELKDDEDNWWEMYFGSAPCSASPDVRFIGDCEVDSSGNYNCLDAKSLSNCVTGVTSVIIYNNTGDGQAVALEGTTSDLGSINLGAGLSGTTELEGVTLEGCSELVFICLDPEEGIVWDESSTSCTLT